MGVLTYIRQKILGKGSSKHGEGAAAAAGGGLAHDHHLPSSSELYGDEDSDDYSYCEEGPAVTGRGGAAILSSRRSGFSGQLDPDSAPNISSRRGDASLSFSRLSFSGESEYESEPELHSESESAESFLRDGNSSRGGSRRLSFSGQLIDSNRDGMIPRSSKKSTLNTKLESSEQGPAIGSSRGEAKGRSSRRVSFSGQLETELGQQPVVTGRRGGKHDSAPSAARRLSFSGQLVQHPQQQQEKGAAIIGKGGLGSMSFSRFSFRKHSRQQDLEPSSGASITNTAGIAGWSSRHLSLTRFAKRAEEHGRGRRPSKSSREEFCGSRGNRSANSRRLGSGAMHSKDKSQEEDVEPKRGHVPYVTSRDGASGGGGNFVSDPVAYKNHSKKRREEEEEHHNGGGPAVRIRDVTCGGGSFSSGPLGSEKDSKKRQEEEHEQWLGGGPSITGRDEASGGGNSISRRLSFQWPSRQKQQQQQDEGPAITGREVATPGNTSSHRFSFRIGRSKQQQEQHEEEQGRLLTRAGSGGAVGGSSRRLSFSGLLSGGDDEDGKAGPHSKRHTQVITMWNPASMTTVQSSSVEKGSKSWLRNASKSWTELGASKRVVLDPIENGPQNGSRNWRTKYFGINPEVRWPVQGW